MVGCEYKFHLVFCSPPYPSLINLMVSVDVKHHVYLLAAPKDGRKTTATFNSIKPVDLLKQHRQQIAERVKQRKQEQEAASQESRGKRQESSSQSVEGGSLSNRWNSQSK